MSGRGRRHPPPLPLGSLRLPIFFPFSHNAEPGPRLVKLTSDVKQRKQRSQNNRTKKNRRCETKKMLTGSKTVVFERRRLSGRRFSDKGRRKIRLQTKATYTEINLKNSYPMYVCRQLFHHPEEIRGFIILHLRSREGVGGGGGSMSEICYIPGVSFTSRRVRASKTNTSVVTIERLQYKSWLYSAR